MSCADSSSTSPSQTNDSVTRTVERLRTMLADPIVGRERPWAEAIGSVLDRVESALRKHRAIAKDPDGLFASVDEIRPTLANQANELRSQHEELLGQVNALRDEVESAVASLQLETDLAAEAMQRKAADLGEVRERIERFLNDLSENKQAETSLVAESDNTDVGVGD